MDWRKVDLTLEGHIGGIDHPDMPGGIRRQQSEGDLYTHIFREHRIDGERVLQIIDDYELGREAVLQTEREAQDEDICANRFMGFFGRFPKWLEEKHPWIRGSMAGGTCCDRCMVETNLLNASQPGCCDICELEMTQQITANPDVVFAFERGGLRAVAGRQSV